MKWIIVYHLSNTADAGVTSNCLPILPHMNINPLSWSSQKRENNYNNHLCNQATIKSTPDRSPGEVTSCFTACWGYQRNENRAQVHFTSEEVVRYDHRGKTQETLRTRQNLLTRCVKRLQLWKCMTLWRKYCKKRNDMQTTDVSFTSWTSYTSKKRECQDFVVFCTCSRDGRKFKLK